MALFILLAAPVFIALLLNYIIIRCAKEMQNGND